MKRKGAVVEYHSTQLSLTFVFFYIISLTHVSVCQTVSCPSWI